MLRSRKKKRKSFFINIWYEYCYTASGTISSWFFWCNTWTKNVLTILEVKKFYSEINIYHFSKCLILQKHLIYLLNWNQTFSSKQTCWLCLLLIYNEEISNCLFHATGFNTFVGSNVTLFSLCATHWIRLLSFFFPYIYVHAAHARHSNVMYGWLYVYAKCVCKLHSSYENFLARVYNMRLEIFIW